MINTAAEIQSVEVTGVTRTVQPAPLAEQVIVAPGVRTTSGWMARGSCLRIVGSGIPAIGINRCDMGIMDGEDVKQI
jgi:hypothetical protein